MTLKDLLSVIVSTTDFIIKERDLDYFLIQNHTSKHQEHSEPEHKELFSTFVDCLGELEKIVSQNYFVEKIFLYPVYIEIIVTRKESR